MRMSRSRSLVAACLLSSFLSTITASGADPTVRTVRNTRAEFRSSSGPATEVTRTSRAAADISRRESPASQTQTSADRIFKTDRVRTREVSAEPIAIRPEIVRSNRTFGELRTAVAAANRSTDKLRLSDRAADRKQVDVSSSFDVTRSVVRNRRTEPSERRQSIP